MTFIDMSIDLLFLLVKDRKILTFIDMPIYVIVITIIMLFCYLLMELIIHNQ